MAVPEYKTQRRRDMESQIELHKKESDKLDKEIKNLIEKSAPFDDIMKVRDNRNNLLIKIQTLESRIANIGRDTGLTEQSIPNFNN